MLAAGMAFATGSCGSDDKDDSGGGPGLRVERFEGRRGPEVVVYVARPADNVPETARGAARVRVRCVDSGKREVVSTVHPWPFTDTDDGLTEAHVHQRLSREQAGEVRSCELLGTRKPLSGKVTDSGY